MSGEDQLKKAAQEWYRKGTDAMNRQNWDFAVECFANSIKMQPDTILFRQTKLGCSRKKYDGNGTGARMASMKLMGTKGKLKKAMLKKDWKQVSELAEEGLAVNPWDVQLLADLGKAGRQMEWDDVAKFGYSKAVEGAMENVEYNRALGEILRARREYKQARKCYERIYKADPTDGDARSAMQEIDAEEVEDRGGYGQAESTRDVKADKEEPKDAYNELRNKRRGNKEAAAPGESAEADLRNAIRKDEKNIALYTKLAEFYRDSRRLMEALKPLQDALKLAPGETSVVELKEDIELDIQREEVAKAEERVQKNPSMERLQEKVKKLNVKLMKSEVEVLERRIENHPNDMRLKMDLADRYRKTKRFKDAIPLLQQATTDSRLQASALVSLGECFVRSGQMSLGKRQFDRALEIVNNKDNPDSFKLAHYYLGRIYEKAGKNDQAEHHYGEILGVDYEYRDARQRLEELQGEDEFADFDEL